MIKTHSARIITAAASPVGEFALRFLRTIALSRLLMPDDLGAATALFAALITCEMVTDFGLDSFVMANIGENRAQAVAAAQRVAIVRAALIGSVIVLFAPFLARVFGIPGQETNIQLLALVPLIRSFKNWRIVQVQAEARYGPQMAANLGSNAAAVIVAAAAAVWFRDARAMLASLLAEVVVYVLLSYLTLPRYRATAAPKDALKSAVKYGLPLALNGVSLAIMSQFDRIIVVNLFGLKVLALYGLVWSLAIAPTAPLCYAAYNLVWPFLKREHRNQSEARYTSLGVLLGQFIAGAGYAICIATLLDLFIPFFFGSQYSVTPGVQATAAGIAFLRISRGSPNTILLASSRTGRLTLGNMAAITGPFIGLLLAMWSGRLDALMLGILIGDALSLAVLLVFVWKDVPQGAVVKHTVLICLPVLLATALPYYTDGLDWRERTALLLGGGLILAWESLSLYQEYFRGFLPLLLRPVGPDLSPQGSKT